MKNENNNVAICDCLKAVVKDTVKHYARDYKIDEARIKQAAKEVAKTGKPQTFLWFARECGTYMGRESRETPRRTWLTNTTTSRRLPSQKPSRHTS